MFLLCGLRCFVSLNYDINPYSWRIRGERKRKVSNNANRNNNSNSTGLARSFSFVFQWIFFITEWLSMNKTLNELRYSRCIAGRWLIIPSTHASLRDESQFYIFINEITHHVVDLEVWEATTCERTCTWSIR